MEPSIDALVQSWNGVAYRQVDGLLLVVIPFAFTWGLCFDVQRDCYRIRYCYATLREALDALIEANGITDPSGDWIKAKGRDLAGLSVDRRRVPDRFEGAA